MVIVTKAFSGRIKLKTSIVSRESSLKVTGFGYAGKTLNGPGLVSVEENLGCQSLISSSITFPIVSVLQIPEYKVSTGLVTFFSHEICIDKNAVVTNRAIVLNKIFIFRSRYHALLPKKTFSHNIN